MLFFGDNGAHQPSDNQGGAYPGTYEHVNVGNTNAVPKDFKLNGTSCPLQQG